MAVKDKLKTDLFPTIWCPGCGIGLIMQQLATVMDELGLDKSNTVLVTGIGCTGRMGAYMNFESVYTLHGRTLPVAEAIKMVRPELHVIVVSGDGDTRLDRRQPPAPLDPPQPEHHGSLQQQRDLRPDRRPDRAHDAQGHDHDLVAGRRHLHADQPPGRRQHQPERLLRQDHGLPPGPDAQGDQGSDRVAGLRVRRHRQPVHREQRPADRVRRARTTCFSTTAPSTRPRLPARRTWNRTRLGIVKGEPLPVAVGRSGNGSGE